MLPIHPIPLVLSILVGLLIGLMVWGFWRATPRKTNRGFESCITN
jgi:hypothetical protein